MTDTFQLQELLGATTRRARSISLSTLLLCILIWSAAYFIVLTPFASLVARRGAAFVLILAFDITAAISLAVLRRGSLRTAAVIYFAGYWLSFTVLILFSGGIRSPGLVFYAAMPISAACAHRPG